VLLLVLILLFSWAAKGLVVDVPINGHESQIIIMIAES